MTRCASRRKPAENRPSFLRTYCETPITANALLYMMARRSKISYKNACRQGPILSLSKGGDRGGFEAAQERRSLLSSSFGRRHGGYR